MVCICVLAETAPAVSEVTSLKISFAGGCLVSNTGGGCAIKSIASGSDLEGEKIVLVTSDGRGAPMRRATWRTSSLNESGVGRSRLHNQPGACYQVRTAPNGNDVPDVYSNVLCETSKLDPIPVAR